MGGGLWGGGGARAEGGGSWGGWWGSWCAAWRWSLFRECGAASSVVESFAEDQRRAGRLALGVRSFPCAVSTGAALAWPAGDIRAQVIALALCVTLESPKNPRRIFPQIPCGAAAFPVAQEYSPFFSRAANACQSRRCDVMKGRISFRLGWQWQATHLHVVAFAQQQIQSHGAMRRSPPLGSS